MPTESSGAANNEFGCNQTRPQILSRPRATIRLRKPCRETSVTLSARPRSLANCRASFSASLLRLVKDVIVHQSPLSLDPDLPAGVISGASNSTSLDTFSLLITNCSLPLIASTYYR